MRVILVSFSCCYDEVVANRTPFSHKGRTGLGVFLRRRAPAQETKGQHNNNNNNNGKTEKGRRKAGSRKHHVFLREEVVLLGQPLYYSVLYDVLSRSLSYSSRRNLGQQLGAPRTEDRKNAETVENGKQTTCAL